MKIPKEHFTRGMRNNNPFNIVYSKFNSWKGKLSPSAGENKFERFLTLDYGLRAGFLLIRNGYIQKGYRTVEEILNRFAPKSENDVHSYLMYVCDGPLHPDTEVSVGSLTFYWLCQKICMYESKYDLSYEKFREIVVKFNLW